MSNYAKIRTSAEVWAGILGRHREELKVFATETDEGFVRTSYGFCGFDWPLIEALTMWDRDDFEPWRRNNERHQYWICVPVSES